MAIILKLLISVVIFVAGILMTTHNYQLTQLFGYNTLAERYLGDGGTYSMWKLLGVAAMIGSLIYVFN